MIGSRLGPMRYEAILTRDLGKEASLLFMGVPQRACSSSGWCGEDLSSETSVEIVVTIRRSQDEDKGGI